MQLHASHRVTFAGLELEVVCFVKHWVLLHEQLLVELLYYLRVRRKETVTIHGHRTLVNIGIHCNLSEATLTGEGENVKRLSATRQAEGW